MDLTSEPSIIGYQKPVRKIKPKIKSIDSLPQEENVKVSLHSALPV
ncbi:MAG TPA: hypothetical protein PKI08_06995 [Aquaticitalea sp.]|nr:hypothetical protein [Aquaticitalea sp.]